MTHKICFVKVMFHIAGLLLLCNFLKICSGRRSHPINNTFTCNNGNRIKSIFKCDNDNDCGDNSDENDCYSYPPKKSCSKNYFQCTNKNCIPKDGFCDGYYDCMDKSDEYKGCEKDLKCEGQFRCTNGYCISKEWVCDGMKDCLDGSDELNCIAIGCKTENYRYQCANLKCISLNLVCNNIFDCTDRSDEGFACNNTISCSLAGCSHDCIVTPDAPVCICPQGYKLQDNHTCTDIDECEIDEICDQQCLNTEGSYKCICQTGYTLQDDMKTCKADGDEAVMIFSEGQKIRGIYLDSQTNFIVAEDLNQINQVAMDNEYIYWSTKDKKIMKATKNGKREYILITGLDEVSDIAVDWITGNIYFTDKGNMNIGVCDNNGTYCTILINGKTKKPTAIALLPTNGIMYWCDSSHKQYIAMAGMDGNDITLLITKKLKYPKSLTIDYPNNRLYWMDIGLMTIESIRLDGTDRKIISREINSQAMSLAIFENKIYWNVKINYHSYSDFDKTQKIQYCNAFSRCNQEILDTNRDYDASNDIQIYHPTMKSKVQNNCFLNPCSQLCLLNKNKNYTCACTLDKKLNSDGHTCQDTEDSQHIIIVADGTIVNYYHNLLGKPKITSSVIFRNITAITYDSLSGTILASNAFTDDIFRYDPISGEIENLIAMNIKSLGGMAFDYIGNNLYLTNIEEKTVEVHSLTTKTKKIFYFEEQSKTPYNIALAPEEGIMFVVFKVKDKYRIDKMQMDGTGTKSLFVESKLLKDSRISLYYHTDEKKIYWADQGSNSIQSALLTGFDYQIRTNLYNPISLTIAGEYIFWTQRHSTNLFWGNKNDIHKKNWEINFVDYINKETGISHLIMPYIIKDGYRKNCGNCSHVCLPSSANSYLCACPGDMTLSEDNHTCI